MKKLLFLLLFLPFLSFSQTSNLISSLPDSTKNVLIHLKDGTSLYGKIVAQKGQEITLRTTTLGDVHVLLSNIESLREVEGFFKNGSFWFNNPHPTRYFWAPSAHNLNKGEAYYQNSYLFINSVNYGVNDNFSMGGGFVLNPTFKEWQLLFFTPKVSFEVAPKLRVGGGALLFTYFVRQYTYNANGITTKNGIKTNGIGIFYANTTYGTPDHNLSLGLGWGFSNSEIKSNPVVNLDYMVRLGKNVSFVTENWIAPNIDGGNTAGIISGGARIFGERLSVDLAVLTPFSTKYPTDLLVIPYVDVVYKFGKRR